MATAEIRLKVPDDFPEAVADSVRLATAAELRRMANALDPDGDPVAKMNEWLTNQIACEATQMERHVEPPDDGTGEWSFHYGMSDAYSLAAREMQRFGHKSDSTSIRKDG